MAILLILLRHFSDGSSLEDFFYLGWTGVDLFFVLSGFLITGILLDTKNRKGYYRVFITRRVLRIFPVYYAVLLVCLVLSGYLSMLAWFRDYQFYFWTYTQNYLIAEKGFFTIPLGHFWSLAIEEQFYVVWPFIVLFLYNRRLIAAILLLLAGGIITRFFYPDLVFTALFTPAHMDGLLIGSMIALLLRINRTLLSKASVYLLVAFTIALTLFIIIEKAWITRTSAFSYFGYTIIALFYGSILIFSFFNKLTRTVLSARWLVFLGKYSYGLYVYHAIIINTTKYYFRHYLNDHRFVTTLVMLLLSFAISYASYHCMEKYFLRLKPGFAGELQTPRSMTRDNT